MSTKANSSQAPAVELQDLGSDLDKLEKQSDTDRAKIRTGNRWTGIDRQKTGSVESVRFSRAHSTRRFKSLPAGEAPYRMFTPRPVMNTA